MLKVFSAILLALPCQLCFKRYISCTIYGILSTYLLSDRIFLFYKVQVKVHTTFKLWSEKSIYSACNCLCLYLYSSKLSTQCDGHFDSCLCKVNHDWEKLSFITITSRDVPVTYFSKGHKISLG